jgi:hypothetical protein
MSCSIDPTKEGIAAFNRIVAQTRQFDARLGDRLQEAMGMQDITITGVPPESYFARTMVAADKHRRKVRRDRLGGRRDQFLEGRRQDQNDRPSTRRANRPPPPTAGSGGTNDQRDLRHRVLQLRRRRSEAHSSPREDAQDL